MKDHTQNQIDKQETMDSSKKKTKVILTTSILIAFLIASMTAYAFRGAIGNTFSLLTNTPTEYYQYILNKNINSKIDKATAEYEDYYTVYSEQYQNGISHAMDIALTMNPTVTALAGLSNFENITATVDTQLKLGDIYSFIDILYNNSSLITFDYYHKEDIDTHYLISKELSPAFLTLTQEDLNEYLDNNQDLSKYPSFNTSTDFLSLYENGTISPSTLNSLLKKYTTLLLSNFNNITLEKKASVTVEDISNKYSKLTVPITKSDLLANIQSILTEAKSDHELMQLFLSLGVCTEDEYFLLLDELTNETNQQNTFLSEYPDEIEMVLYVNLLGSIMGQEFTWENDNVPYTSGYLLTNHYTDFGISGWYTKDNEKVMELLGTGIYKDKKISGTITINYLDVYNLISSGEPYTAELAFTDVSIDETENISESYTITTESLPGATLEISRSTLDNQYEIIINAVYGGIDAATINIKNATGKYEEIVFPDESEEYFNALEDILSYAKTVDFYGFIQKLDETLNSEDLSSILFQLLYNYIF